VLTKDLLRFKREGDRLVPLFVKPTPQVRQGCEDLLGFYRHSVGRTRGELQELATPILYRMRSMVVARGLQKLILDRCTFTDPADAAELRWRALEASAAALGAPPDRADAHRAAVAAELELDPDELAAALYADLPQEARLEAVPEWSVEALIDRYNLSLVQGLIARCGEIELTVADADVGRRRQLLKNLRFQRLLAEQRGGDGAELRLTISGPGAVIDQANRYGLQLANFVPAITALSAWTLVARAPKRGGTITLSETDGLRADNKFLAYQPEELRDLIGVLGDKCPDWELDDEPALLTLPGGELVVPDLALAVPERDQRLLIELFHRWHMSALARRVALLESGKAPGLVLGVDRALAKLKDSKPLVERAEATGRAFLFSGYPTATALKRLVKHLG